MQIILFPCKDLVNYLILFSCKKLPISTQFLHLCFRGSTHKKKMPDQAGSLLKMYYKISIKKGNILFINEVKDNYKYIYIYWAHYLF